MLRLMFVFERKIIWMNERLLMSLVTSESLELILTLVWTFKNQRTMYHKDCKRNQDI